MTGTLDDSPIADTKAADRRLPYDQPVDAKTRGRISAYV